MFRDVAVRLSSVTLLAFGIAFPAAGQEEFTLRYKLDQGKSYRFIDTVNVKSSQEMMGREIKATSSVRAATDVLASEVRSDGSTVLTLTPAAMSVIVKSPQMDTTITPTEMIGKRSRTSISPLGVATKREPIDSVKITGMTRTAAQRELVRFHVFPQAPVKAGGTWTATRGDTTDAMGSKVIMVTTMTYSVVGKEMHGAHQALKVSYKGKVTITGTGSMMGSDFFIEGSGTTGGTAFIDLATGLSLLEDSSMDMESTIALTGQQKMTIPSSQSVVSHHLLAAE